MKRNNSICYCIAWYKVVCLCMKKNRIQVILPDAIVDDFAIEAEKQNRTYSGLARKLIVDGLYDIKSSAKRQSMLNEANKQIGRNTKP